MSDCFLCGWAWCVARAEDSCHPRFPCAELALVIKTLMSEDSFVERALFFGFLALLLFPSFLCALAFTF